jgi:hypothetical protein
MSIVEKIKRHPIITTSVFVSAAVIGLSSFTQAIASIYEVVSCFPNKLGLDDGLKGSGQLSYRVQKFDWVKVGEVSNEKSTGNHHCSRNCKGEPTRTSYSIEVSVDEFSAPQVGDKKLMHPTLSCVSGPCAYSDSRNVKLVDASKVKASFDVWSRPTTWNVKAEVFEYKVISESKFDEGIMFSEYSLLTIVIPSGGIEPVFEGTYDDNNVFSFNIGDEGKDVFSLASKTESSIMKTYKYIITNTQCE